MFKNKEDFQKQVKETFGLVYKDIFEKNVKIPTDWIIEQKTDPFIFVASLEYLLINIKSLNDIQAFFLKETLEHYDEEDFGDFPNYSGKNINHYSMKENLLEENDFLIDEETQIYVKNNYQIHKGYDGGNSSEILNNVKKNNNFVNYLIKNFPQNTGIKEEVRVKELKEKEKAFIDENLYLTTFVLNNNEFEFDFDNNDYLKYYLDEKGLPDLKKSFAIAYSRNLRVACRLEQMDFLSLTTLLKENNILSDEDQELFYLENRVEFKQYLLMKFTTLILKEINFSLNDYEINKAKERMLKEYPFLNEKNNSSLFNDIFDFLNEFNAPNALHNIIYPQKLLKKVFENKVFDEIADFVLDRKLMAELSELQIRVGILSNLENIDADTLAEDENQEKLIDIFKDTNKRFQKVIKKVKNTDILKMKFTARNIEDINTPFLYTPNIEDSKIVDYAKKELKKELIEGNPLSINSSTKKEIVINNRFINDVIVEITKQEIDNPENILKINPASHNIIDLSTVDDFKIPSSFLNIIDVNTKYLPEHIKQYLLDGISIETLIEKFKDGNLSESDFVLLNDLIVLDMAILMGNVSNDYEEKTNFKNETVDLLNTIWTNFKTDRDVLKIFDNSSYYTSSYSHHNTVVQKIAHLHDYLDFLISKDDIKDNEKKLINKFTISFLLELELGRTKKHTAEQKKFYKETILKVFELSKKANEEINENSFSLVIEYMKLDVDKKINKIVDILINEDNFIHLLVKGNAHNVDEEYLELLIDKLIEKYGLRKTAELTAIYLDERYQGDDTFPLNNILIKKGFQHDETTTNLMYLNKVYNKIGIVSSSFWLNLMSLIKENNLNKEKENEVLFNFDLRKVAKLLYENCEIHKDDIVIDINGIEVFLHDSKYKHAISAFEKFTKVNKVVKSIGELLGGEHKVDINDTIMETLNIRMEDVFLDYLTGIEKDIWMEKLFFQYKMNQKTLSEFNENEIFAMMFIPKLAEDFNNAFVDITCKLSFYEDETDKIIEIISGLNNWRIDKRYEDLFDNNSFIKNGERFGFLDLLINHVGIMDDNFVEKKLSLIEHKVNGLKQKQGLTQEDCDVLSFRLKNDHVFNNHLLNLVRKKYLIIENNELESVKFLTDKYYKDVQKIVGEEFEDKSFADLTKKEKSMCLDEIKCLILKENIKNFFDNVTVSDVLKYSLYINNDVFKDLINESHNNVGIPREFFKELIIGFDKLDEKGKVNFIKEPSKHAEELSFVRKINSLTTNIDISLLNNKDISMQTRYGLSRAIDFYQEGKLYLDNLPNDKKEVMENYTKRNMETFRIWQILDEKEKWVDEEVKFYQEVAESKTDFIFRSGHPTIISQSLTCDPEKEMFKDIFAINPELLLANKINWQKIFTENANDEDIKLIKDYFMSSLLSEDIKNKMKYVKRTDSFLLYKFNEKLGFIDQLDGVEIKDLKDTFDQVKIINSYVYENVRKSLSDSIEEILYKGNTFQVGKKVFDSMEILVDSSEEINETIRLHERKLSLASKMKVGEKMKKKKL